MKSLPSTKHNAFILTYISGGVERKMERPCMRLYIAVMTMSHHHMQKHVPCICSVPYEAQLLQRNLHFVAQQAGHQRLQTVKRVHHTAVWCREQTWKQLMHARYSGCSPLDCSQCCVPETEKSQQAREITDGALSTGFLELQHVTLALCLGWHTSSLKTDRTHPVTLGLLPKLDSKWTIITATDELCVRDTVLAKTPDITLHNCTHWNCVLKQHLAIIYIFF